MSSWKKERKRDFYYREAKRLGYRARSAFKLIEIQKRFKIIRKGDVILDLGAAPGGWSQVALEYSGGEVIGIDILPVRKMDNFVFIEGDVTSDETKNRLREVLGRRKVDVVLSDMSPNLSGNRALDQARSYWLCIKALEYADEFLRRGGNFVCKGFEGSDLNEFFKEVRIRFRFVRKFSPKASKKRSKEVYIIGIGKLLGFSPDFNDDNYDYNNN